MVKHCDWLWSWPFGETIFGLGYFTKPLVNQWTKSLSSSISKLSCHYQLHIHVLNYHITHHYFH
jgi:hypothetical protein